jgi:hypothetical protein
VTAGLLRTVVALAVATSPTACARIHTTTTVEVRPRVGAVPVRLPGSVHTHTARHVARWLQLGDELVVEIEEFRTCREQLHLPVVRVETFERRADHSLAIEWILTAGIAGFAAFAFARPETFGAPVRTSEGELIRDPRAGHQTGGVFAGIAAIGLSTSIYDTVRTRDTVAFTDAYRVVGGEAVACAVPRAPFAHRTVTLVVGEFESTGRTDRDGRVRLRLPPVSESVAGKVPLEVRPAAVRLDRARALAVDYRIPYGSSETNPARSGPATEDRGDSP